jgi:hypothetical protein
MSKRVSRKACSDSVVTSGPERKYVAIRAACESLEERICLSETVSVPTDGSSVTSNMVLTAGVNYQLRASGDFYIGIPTDGLADAEYGDFTDPKDVSTTSGVDYGISVNGSRSIKWGAYSSDHVYTVDFTGTGTPLTFGYADDYYGDNSGGLYVEILSTQPPVAPTGLVATDVRASKVTLQWDDNSGDEYGFVVEQQGGDYNDFTPVAWVGTDTTEYTVTGLKPSTAYQFRVAAYNDVGNSDYSNVVNVTTADVDEGTMPPNDDSFSEQLYFGFSINFLGRQFDQLYVNNNGNLTFDGPQGTYSPQELTTNYGPIIAPFFADVDTRNDGGGGTITYAPLTVNDHKAYKVTWDQVGYYNEHYDKRNTFSVSAARARPARSSAQGRGTSTGRSATRGST